MMTEFAKLMFAFQTRDADWIEIRLFEDGWLRFIKDSRYWRFTH